MMDYSEQYTLSWWRARLRRKIVYNFCVVLSHQWENTQLSNIKICERCTCVKVNERVWR